MAPSQASPAPSQSSAISPGKINVQGHLGVCCLGHPGTVPRTCPGSRWLAGAWDWLPRLRGGSWHRRWLTWTMSLLVAWGNIPVEGKAGAGAVFRHFKKTWGTTPAKPAASAGAAEQSAVTAMCGSVRVPGNRCGGSRGARPRARPRRPGPGRPSPGAPGALLTKARGARGWAGSSGWVPRGYCPAAAVPSSP